MLVLAAILLLLLGVVWTQQRKLIYFPSAAVPHPQGVGLTDASAVTFSTTDGVTLNGWFIASKLPSSFTVVVFNGNAGNRAYRAPLARAVANQGFAVLLFDYRGFGGNSGSPT